MLFQYLGDRTAGHSMVDVSESALDSRITPARVLLRHTNGQFADLAHDTRPAQSTMRIRPLGGDEPPVPPQDRLGRHDRRDLPQRLETQRTALRGQPAPLVIAEAEAPPPRLELFLENTILFDEVCDHASLATVGPGGEGRQEQLEFDLSGERIRRGQLAASQRLRLFGHYAAALASITQALAARPHTREPRQLSPPGLRIQTIAEFAMGYVWLPERDPFRNFPAGCPRSEGSLRIAPSAAVIPEQQRLLRDCPISAGRSGAPAIPRPRGLRQKLKEHQWPVLHVRAQQNTHPRSSTAGSYFSNRTFPTFFPSTDPTE